MNRDNIRAAIGWICIISLLTSLFTYLISAAHMTVILVSLGAGLLCAVVFIVLEPGKFFSFFSNLFVK